MDKNAIKKYAVWARRELIEKVSQKALQYGIEEGKEADSKLESVNGVLLSDVEKKQRQALINKINEFGYTQVIEEVAYTWFNRFIALRFMEVNGYLPSHVRVFTDEAGGFKPQIMSEALHLDIDGIDMEKVYSLKNDNKDDELFKYLLIAQCNALSEIFPKMFQRIADYTELLLPDYLLREGSVIEQMVNQKDGIPEADWQDQVQIIGWLYQYYNTEPKDKVFSDLKKNIKVSKDKIPAATQLFTPDWIVHYMVENSLGRLWLEGHPNKTLQAEWEYFIEEADQEENVRQTLDRLCKEYSELKPDEIRCIDPCMGSGHVLCVLFDVLVRIYEDYGYTAREAAVSIVEKNIWGLDIDDRAAQLSYFAIMMKARQYDRRFLSRNIQPHVHSIRESNDISDDYVTKLGKNLSIEERSRAIEQVKQLVRDFYNAKEYGSLIKVNEYDWNLLRKYSVLGDSEGQLSIDTYGEIEASNRLQEIICIGEALSQKYDVVVTNPPYMGGSNMSPLLLKLLKEEYDEAKGDLYAVFIQRIMDMLKPNGYESMVTMHTWMFISSFEKFRHNILSRNIVNVAHHGSKAFESDVGTIVQTVSFVIRNCHMPNYISTYEKLTDYNNSADKAIALKSKTCDFFMQKNEAFELIPGENMAYWLDEHLLKAFENEKIATVALSDGQTKTGDNDKYLRRIWEVNPDKIGKDKKWSYIAKGGSFRKWYGNIDTIIDWSETARRHYRSDHVARIAPEYIWFKHGFVFNHIAESEKFAVREIDTNTLFETAAPAIFIDDDKKLFYVMGYLNTWIAREVIVAFNPTFNTNVRDITTQPIIWESEEEIEKVNEHVLKCIEICKDEWDSFETSSDFALNPLVQLKKKSIAEAEEQWIDICKKRNADLEKNEIWINDFFTNIYGLSDSKMNKEVNIARLYMADPQNDIKALISYSVGCMFGRYSLDMPGIAFAGGRWEESKYNLFKPDVDAIIPICDDEYFNDDIVSRFIEFIEIAFGKEMIEDNLQYIADVLGGKGNSREIIRNYFLNSFYSDHLKTYQKRPIYWLFDSGKKNGFKCLIYMHRYQPDTIARIRTDYVHEQQARYRTAIEETEKRIESATGSDKIKLTKKLNTLKTQDEEIHAYEEKIHHLADKMISIDLDDGVKHNYEIFKDVLAKIK